MERHQESDTTPTCTGRRLLVISPGVPHRTYGASTVLFYYYIARLKAEGFCILNILLLDASSDLRGLAEYTSEMGDPGRFDIATQRSQRFLHRTPLRFRLDPEAANAIRRQGEAFKPDIILCFDLLSAWLAKPLEAVCKVAWLGDLNFQTEWYHALYETREKPWMFFKLPFKRYHALLWKLIYHSVLPNVDAAIVSSKSSEQQLARIGIPSRYLPYPWPNVSRNPPERTSATRRYEKPSFLFFGSLVGLGSRSAFHFLIGRLYPLLVKQWGRDGFQVFIAGMHDLPAWVAQALNVRPEIKFLSFVQDIDTLLAACHAVVIPIEVPVGNRSRIVTAMAKGALVVAHANAALGNPDLVDGATCYLARSAEEFMDRMALAYSAPAIADAITVRARAAYQRLFEPDVASQMLVEVILRCYNDGRLQPNHHSVSRGRTTP